MNYWMVKSEPFKYSWDQFVKDGKTFWDGVRNYQARNNMKLMKKGDHVMFYHSNEGLEVVGVAEVINEFYQDPTTDDDRWVAVDIKPIAPIKNPVTLKSIKAEPTLQEVYLVRNGRLSVMPLEKSEYEKIMEMGS
ncbi:MAG: putative RNA-binding protein with PUA-like domain [Sphingobacteriales bacterium]|jgi:predicted RNA-binding protein with PUA-like domain